MEEREDRIVCKFCKQPRAQYFCLECRSLFCENCAHIEVRDFNLCGACCSTEFRELKEKKGTQETVKVVCVSCGSSQIKKGKQKALLCPACEKKHFETIPKYQHYLYTQYREYCNALAIPLDVLHQFTTKLDGYKESVLTLRNQGYFTYSILEEKLLGTYTSFDTIKNKVLERESHYLSILRRYVIDFLSKKRINPYMFKDYMEKLETIELEWALYRRSVDKLLDNFVVLFAELECSLNILDYHREQFEKWRDVLNLSLKEVPLCSLPEIVCTGGVSSLSVKTGRGHLFFTSQRMIFVGKRGLLSKSSVKFFELPISKIIGCTVHKGVFSKKALLKTTNGVVSFSGDEKVLVTLVKYVEFMNEWTRYCVRENLIEELKRCEVTLFDIKQKIDGDLQGLLNSKYPQLFPVVLKPRFRVGPMGRVERPRVIPRVRKNSRDPAILKELAQKLSKLKREKYVLLKTIEALETKFRSGRMPEAFYLQEYRTLTGELYMVDTQLDELNGTKR